MTTIDTIFEHTSIDCVLLDAAGVLYNGNGAIANSAKSVAMLQKRSHVYVVTNDTCHYTDEISARLACMDIYISAQAIISSGLAFRLVEHIHRFIKGRNIYVFGKESSYPYLIDAGAKEIVQDLRKANVIALTSSLEEKEQRQKFSQLQLFLSEQTPKYPLICCNPDNYTKGTYGLKPVIGYYASKLEQQRLGQLYWSGKPHANFSYMLENILQQHGSFKAETTCFFDDNLENVMALKQHLGIKGAWITDTGISYTLDQQEAIKRFGQPDFILPTLGSHYA